jgi:antitoxin (DNA-binding transcriptional repressor) of toxin-antitoxin stability system
VVNESVLTARGEVVADIVPQAGRSRWIDGEHLPRELKERAADAGLRQDLDRPAGRTLEEL